jgi:two-component system, sensor histidine kinase and response regulator
MNFLQQQALQFQQRMKAVDNYRVPADWKERLPDATSKQINLYRHRLFSFHNSIKLIGAQGTTDDYEKRKLGIFNQLNFFQFVTGICIPLEGLFNNKLFPDWVFLVASLPALISLVVLWLNSQCKFEEALIFYFLFYPVVTSIVFMSGIDVGAELFFILYGILSVFFIQRISHMIFSVALSMVSYFMLAVVLKNHRYQLESTNMFLYLFHQFAGIVFIFYGLYLIKRENSSYQVSIAEKAALLEKQTQELTELNAVKNKLFSVIAHDLKMPMYALRNLFNNIQQQKLPAKDIKATLPDVINNLNYTTGLMENLLSWAKSQMQSETVKSQPLDIAAMIREVVQLLHLQAEAKQIRIEIEIPNPVLIMADKNMISLVIRNLLSNAIKFTPANGKIAVGVHEGPDGAEVLVKDSGTGISAEAMQKINRNDYFSTNGTAHEPGTGLGLMLCKEFLLKNSSRLFIESEPGKGSVFSFTLIYPA